MSNETEKQSVGTYENKTEADKTEADTVKRRLRAIELASAEEADWRKDVEEAEKLYRAEQESKGKGGNFNIYFSNIETLVPSLYNSTPVPDIRRRFGDADPVAKMGADILERTISQSIDEYDFDGTIEDIIQDLGIACRGVARVVYDVGLGDVKGVEDITYQTVSCEHVPWNMFRRGPASHWHKVPWVAFAHYLGREALVALSPKWGAKVNLDLTLESSTGDKKDKEPSKPEGDIFKRTLVWEIWDREEKAVIFIAPSFPEHHLLVTPDPLGLKNFFPTPRPIMGSKTSGKLVPICDYRIYKDLLKELDDITVRIRKLVKQLRPRVLAAVPTSSQSDIERWAKSSDSDVAFADNVTGMLDAGGVEKLLAFWPMEPTAKAIQALYERRDGVKQDIYEVVGLSDIMRGSVDPQEKLGQSQMKSQWGSLRTGRKQKDVQRFIRDLFRLKAEIVCKHFEPQTLAMITGINPNEPGPPGPPQQGPDGQPMPPQPSPPLFPQAIELLKQDAQRAYRIDIETDSTIRGDVTRNMEQMTQFVQGSGGYFQAMAVAVESGIFPAEAAITIYKAFARNFRLGKEAEDTLEKLSTQPPPPKPDPNQQKMELEKAKADMQGQVAQQKLAMDQQSGQMKMQLETQKGQHQMAIAGQKLEMDKQAHAADLQFKQQEAKMDLIIQMVKAQNDQKMAQQEMGMKRELGHQEMQLNREQAHQQAQISAGSAYNEMNIARFKAKQQAKQQSQKPKGNSK